MQDVTENSHVTIKVPRFGQVAPVSGKGKIRFYDFDLVSY